MRRAAILGLVSTAAAVRLLPELPPRAASPSARLRTPEKCVEQLDFHGGEQGAYSNLGGLGPDTDRPRELRFLNIGVDHKSGLNIDLVIKNRTRYQTSATYPGGLVGDTHVGRISLDQGADVLLNLSFVGHGTETPVTLELAKLTLCDIDQGDPREAKAEIYTIDADAFYIVPEGPDFTYEFMDQSGNALASSAMGEETVAALHAGRFTKRIFRQGGGQFRVKVTSAERGTECDNPTNFSDLSNVTYDETEACKALPSYSLFQGTVVDQAKRCFAFELDNAFSTRLMVQFGKDGVLTGYHRSMLISGASTYFNHETPCPTPSPTPAPSAPTNGPTAAPSVTPTSAPTNGPTAAPSMTPTSAPTNGSTPSPTLSPSGGPTALPSMTPTAAPTGTPTAGKITGDPHVTNVEGQRFNLVRVGVHELLRLPRWPGSRPGQGAGGEALLRVSGSIESERSCEEPFVKQLDLSGLWLRQSGPLALRAGGLDEDSEDAITLQVNGSRVGKDEIQGLLPREVLQVAKPKARPSRRHGARARRDELFSLKFRFSGATLTVDWVHREVPGSSLNHLDLHVADLPRLGTGMDVGGILGRDDHASAAMASPGCERTQSLLGSRRAGADSDVPGSLLGASYGDLQ